MRPGVITLDALYLHDSMVTWAVRGNEGVKELNPVISGLHGVDPLFYVAFRVGALLMVNVLLWQIYVESPRSFGTRWFKALVACGIAIYTIPLAMSVLLL